MAQALRKQTTFPLSDMRVALLTIDYPPDCGGVARYLGNLVYVSQGMIDVFLPAGKTSIGHGKVESVTFFWSGPIRWWPVIWFIRSLKKRGYSYVFVSHALPIGTAALIARWFGGLPYVVLMHGLDLRLALRSKRKAWVLHRVLRGATKVMANSEAVAQELGGLDASLRPIVLTPGVESMTFSSRESARASLAIHQKDFIILSVGRLITRKGFDVIIQTLAFLPPEVRLVIVGHGPQKERLCQLVAEQDVENRVTFVYHASDEERNRWYAAADIFVLPVRDEGNDVEGFGVVYLEAALAGLPAIAGKSGGAVEAVVDQETGILVDPQDIQQMAFAIKKMMDDPFLRKKMGEAGRARALKDFRWEERWEKLKSLL